MRERGGARVRVRVPLPAKDIPGGRPSSCQKKKKGGGRVAVHYALSRLLASLVARVPTCGEPARRGCRQ